MTRPEVSVVMGVYNEQAHLNDTIDSVLSQQGVELELIIVNDGSQDSSASIIRDYATKDSRIHLINQGNQGLTKALIMGCKHANAPYIARQDAGDLSLAGRLKAQKDLLDSQQSVSLCSTGVVYLAPDGEKFGETIQSEDEAREGLKRLDLTTIQGPPHHGSVMFRTDTYKLVGGYREQFYVAQDLDLWTRMIHHGEHRSIQSILYEAAVDKSSISSQKRAQQLAAASVIIECCRARAELGSDEQVLERALAALSYNQEATKPQAESDFYYYIGSRLEKTNKTASRKYLRKAIEINLLNWKPIVKLLRSYIA